MKRPPNREEAKNYLLNMCSQLTVSLEDHKKVQAAILLLADIKPTSGGKPMDDTKEEGPSNEN